MLPIHVVFESIHYRMTSERIMSSGKWCLLKLILVESMKQTDIPQHCEHPDH